MYSDIDIIADALTKELLTEAKGLKFEFHSAHKHQPLIIDICIPTGWLARIHFCEDRVVLMYNRSSCGSQHYNFEYSDPQFSMKEILLYVCKLAQYEDIYNSYLRSGKEDFVGEYLANHK